MATDEQRIGYGLLKPFRREATDFAAGTGAALIKSCVRTVINTRAAGFNGALAGEYPWRKSFGCWLHALRHRPINPVQGEKGIVFAAMAIQRWEPRVVAETGRSSVLPTSGADRTKTIRIYYSLSEDVSTDTLPAPYAESYEEAAL